MEKSNVYDVFEGMMKDLIIELPEDPVKHMLDKLKPENKSESLVIIMGPPGSQ